MFGSPIVPVGLGTVVMIGSGMCGSDGMIGCTVLTPCEPKPELLPEPEPEPVPEPEPDPEPDSDPPDPFAELTPAPAVPVVRVDPVALRPDDCCTPGLLLAVAAAAPALSPDVVALTGVV
ncbi:MAG: hypothetical protein WBH47_01635 [Streptosporangiaceae bacterium]